MNPDPVPPALPPNGPEVEAVVSIVTTAGVAALAIATIDSPVVEDELPFVLAVTAVIPVVAAAVVAGVA